MTPSPPPTSPSTQVILLMTLQVYLAREYNAPPPPTHTHTPLQPVPTQTLLMILKVCLLRKRTQCCCPPPHHHHTHTSPPPSPGNTPDEGVSNKQENAVPLPPLPQVILPTTLQVWLSNKRMQCLPPNPPTAPPAQVILTPDDFAGVSIRQENVLVPTLALVRALGVDAGLAAAAWGFTLVHVCNTRAASNHTIITVMYIYHALINALSGHMIHTLNTIIYAHV